MLEASLAPPFASEQTSVLVPRDEGVAGWAVWPMTEYVARRGRGDVARALAALHAMTQRFSAEFAAGETRALRKRHAVKAITTRRYYAGRHRVEVLVNGEPVAEAAFELEV